MGKRLGIPADMTPTVDNVLTTYYSAEDDELAAGMTWYATAHGIALELEPDDVRIGAGVLAALSPQTAWGERKGENIELARRAFKEGKATGHTGDACRKATAILSHWRDPEDVLGGFKVRNFYAAIVDPQSETAVCIDRHAFDIAVGRVTDNGTRKTLERVGVYETFADIYRQAAAIIGATPAQVQAVTWLAWRRAKGIVDPEGRP